MSEERVGYIYTLSDLLSPDEVRYVGQTVDPKSRYKGHIRTTSKQLYPAGRWLAKLKREGRSPLMRVVETCPESSINAAEIFWIVFFRREGANLTNRAVGGQDSMFKYLTLAQRQENGRRSLAKQRATMTPEQYHSRYAKAQATRDAQMSREEFGRRVSMNKLSRPPELRTQIGNKAVKTRRANFSPEQISEWTKKSWERYKSARTRDEVFQEFSRRAKKRLKDTTPEQRSADAMKGAVTRKARGFVPWTVTATSEEKTARALIAWETRRGRGGDLSWFSTMTPEERTALAKKASDASAIARKSVSPELKSQWAFKGHESRRRKKEAAGGGAAVNLTLAFED